MPKDSTGKGKGKSGASSSGKGKGHGVGGGSACGGPGRRRGNHRVDQVCCADHVLDADKEYVKNALNPADDPLHEELIDESRCIHQVDVAAGGRNA